ncbi:protein HOMOLOG OF MAMMALIAN LYST-INTERACTING PROTEIN 5-like [Punica granatum]|uniref:Protein HOMOLOG OF MAMMALIAN LYST-INTERACTING PROTEIN 5-like n=1 Tax=Punica granatum TaxID=22663 RepID=A0A6P8DQ09_PUNGR|nr:protein HOMOLOG OF MAMMALIAN LYST-INTERACTING PROTEIN 5-like [Punica granatum]
MDRGLKIPAGERTKTANALLNSLIKQLEKDKKSLNLGPEDSLHLEVFALNVFAKADKRPADLNTAKTFYAASIFFEILSQFGPLQPDLEQKQKQALWKAADIRKALKEGRKLVPGPPAGEDDLSVPSRTPGGSYICFLTLSPQNYRSEQQLQSTGYSSEHFSQIPQIPHNYPSDHYNYLPQSQQDIPNNYLSQDNPPYSHRNFQSYPSFTKSSLPSVPAHDPSYYEGPETSHIPSNKSYPSVPQYGSSFSSSRTNGSVSSQSVLAPTPAQAYQYGSNYRPPPEKIAEAHKAVGFAVGA